MVVHATRRKVNLNNLPTEEEHTDEIGSERNVEKKTQVVVSNEIKKLYKVIQKHTGAVGGYGHDGPVYGEVTAGSFQRVVEFMKEHVAFDKDSSFLDIGAGLGKPNMHVRIDPGVRHSCGIEVEALRWKLSLHNLEKIMTAVPSVCSTGSPSQPTPNLFFLQNDVTKIGSFWPFTHIYMFDVGFPPVVLAAIAESFNNTSTVLSLVCFAKPKKIIEKYKFNVELVDGVQTTMAGSSEGHRAFVFRHKDYEARLRAHRLRSNSRGKSAEGGGVLAPEGGKRDARPSNTPEKPLRAPSDKRNGETRTPSKLQAAPRLKSPVQPRSTPRALFPDNPNNPNKSNSPNKINNSAQGSAGERKLEARDEGAVRAIGKSRYAASSLDHALSSDEENESVASTRSSPDYVSMDPAIRAGFQMVRRFGTRAVAPASAAAAGASTPRAQRSSATSDSATSSSASPTPSSYHGLIARQLQSLFYNDSTARVRKKPVRYGQN